MTRSPRFIFPILLCLSFFAPFALAQKVKTTVDEQYDFSQHKHYKWRDNRLMTRQSPDTNQVMDIKIVKAVNQLLASKGFVEVQDNPDFFIHYDAGNSSQISIAGATDAGSGPKTSADIGPDYGLGNGPSLAPATWLKVNGIIEFHLVDATSHKQVWLSDYRKTFRDPNKALDNLDKEVNELVSKSFKDFPPKSNQ